MNRHFTKADIRMTQKHLKMSISVVLREMKIKTMLRSHYTSIRMVKILKILIISNADKDVEQLELIYCWLEFKIVPTL